MSKAIHKLKSVKPGAIPHSLDVVWKSGRQASVDLSGVISRLEAFATLRDESLFSQVKIIDHGWAVAWPGGLDFPSDSLERLADEQSPMTRKEFMGWQSSLGLSNRETADWLGVSLGTLKNYRSGKTPIPKATQIACRAAAADPLLMQAHYRPRRAGRPRAEARSI